MDATQVLTYDPEINMILFFAMGLVAVGFVANSIINFNKFNNIGKLLFFVSFIPLIGLIIYETGSGYWADGYTFPDEVAITGYYVRDYIGSGTENYYLICSMLLNTLAYLVKDN